MSSPRWVALLLLVMTGGCGVFAPSAPGPPSPTAAAPEPAPAPPPANEAAVPEWRVGDRWTYDWVSGQERGTRTAEVSDVTTVNGVDYYVVDTGVTLQQYYTRDLHFAAGVQASRVVTRMVPPQAWFVWPLRPSAQWRYQGAYQEAQSTKVQNDAFAVVGIEQITVPAGTFRAFKIVRQTDRQDADEYWYAPDVRWYVRWIGRRGEVEFDEQLKLYEPTSRDSSGPATR